MNHLKTTSALLPLALAAALAGCAQQPTATNPSATPAAAAAKTTAQVQRQALAKGLYELAYSPRQNALFVASSGGFGPDASPAKVLRLNPQTLAVEGEIPLERKAFGVAFDDASGRLYVGNTVDLSVTVVDTLAAQMDDEGAPHLRPGAKTPCGDQSDARANRIRLCPNP